ncbi:MAG: glycosyl hydrolase family 28-related protein [Cyclobacteriaceae bacterium]
MIFKLLKLFAFSYVSCFSVCAQSPEILDPVVQKRHYLPDFSYAGYRNGSVPISFEADTVLAVESFGAFPDDGKDDSKALTKLLRSVKSIDKKVLVRFPSGRFIISDILYLNRNNIVLQGNGSGENGTILYFPRPMKNFEDPENLQELREYLVEFDKRQREKDNNIDLPFSQYAWSGGMIWTKVDGERVKSYLPKYNRKLSVLAEIMKGKRGELQMTVKNPSELKVGEVVQIAWFNKSGENGTLIDEIYQTRKVKKIGSHHWNFEEEPLVKQQVRITGINRNVIEISSPLLINIDPKWEPVIMEWKHLENVGIEGFRIVFPMAETIAHHVEEGFNAIYLTRLYDSWVQDVSIENADAAILTEEVANVTIDQVITTGEKLSHYSVYVGGVHNVLVKRLRVENKVRHPLSFNTFATKSVFKECEVHIDPILDQHSGANHQNLFDNIEVNISLNGKTSYPLFAGGGAGYWKPSHGAFSTFWNIKVRFLDNLQAENPILLNGMKDGPYARLIGVSGNKQIKINYGPEAYIEMTNESIQFVPSLYDYQLEKRLLIKK